MYVVSFDRYIEVVDFGGIKRYFIVVKLALEDEGSCEFNIQIFNRPDVLIAQKHPRGLQFSFFWLNFLNLCHHHVLVEFKDAPFVISRIFIVEFELNQFHRDFSLRPIVIQS